MKAEVGYAHNKAEARDLLAKGYEPIECCFGNESVVGDFKLDHHGPYASQLPVSLIAHRHARDLNFKPLTKIAFTGKPDPDCVYAGLVMTRTIHTHSLIAQAIAALDENSIGIDQTEGYYLRVVAFRMQAPTKRSLHAHQIALGIGERVFSFTALSPAMIQDALTYESQRAGRATKALVRVQDDVALVHSDEDSRDLWHRDLASLVVQYKPKQHVITFSGCKPQAVWRLRTRGVQRESITSLLGEKGLFHHYAALDELFGKEGSGGRADIGGSPQNHKATEQDAKHVFHFFTRLTQQRPPQQAAIS